MLAAVPRTRATPTEIVVCADCGTMFTLSRRNVLEHDRKGSRHRCSRCRHPHAGPTAAQVETMKGWWVTRYSVEELRSWEPLL